MKPPWIALSISLVLQPWAAQAQEAPQLPEAVAWSDVVRLVHEKSPRLRAIQSQTAVAEAGVGVAGVLPNPSLSYTGYGRVGHGDQYGTQHEIGVEVPLWLAGQRGARVRSAERRAELARAEAATSETELEASALRAWLGLLDAQTRVATLEQAQREVASLAETVHARVAAGAQSAYDAARVDLESAELATRLATEHAEAQEQSAAFAEALGIPGWHPRAVGTLSPLGLDPNFAALWRAAAQKLPQLVAAEHADAVAASDLELARAERWPALTVSAGTLLTTDQGSTALMLGVSAPIPLLDFGGAAMDQARAAQASANAEHHSAELAAKARLEAAVAGLRNKRAALTTYEQQVGARLPGLRDMAKSAYESGRANVLELLDSFRTGIDVALERSELTRDVLDAELDVLGAAGLIHDPAATRS
ncbi:MAG TPA: TolC family protein [Polyangiales bacterium]|nr:TolC family protein [Polyangiales bacterium]